MNLKILFLKILIITISVILIFSFSIVLYTKNYIFNNDTLTYAKVEKIYSKYKDDVVRIYSTDDRYMLYLIKHWLDKENKISYIFNNNIIHPLNKETKNKIKNSIISDLNQDGKILWFMSKLPVSYKLNDEVLNVSINGTYFGNLDVSINNLKVLFEDKNHLIFIGNITNKSMSLYEYY